VGLEKPAQRLPERLHYLPVVRLLEVRRRESTRKQQAVPLGDRKVEVLREVDEKLAARAGPTGLHEAQVLRGDVGVERELQLSEPALRPPEADQLPRGLGLLLGLDGHAITVPSG
jgi:hypothetical protein